MYDQPLATCLNTQWSGGLSPIICLSCQFPVFFSDSPLDLAGRPAQETLSPSPLFGAGRRARVGGEEGRV